MSEGINLNDEELAELQAANDRRLKALLEAGYPADVNGLRNSYRMDALIQYLAAAGATDLERFVDEQSAQAWSNVLDGIETELNRAKIVQGMDLSPDNIRRLRKGTN